MTLLLVHPTPDQRTRLVSDSLLGNPGFWPLVAAKSGSRYFGPPPAKCVIVELPTATMVIAIQIQLALRVSSLCHINHGDRPDLRTRD